MARKYSPRIIENEPPGFGQTPASVFQYPTLPSTQHTRLVILAPGSHDDQIAFELTPHRVGDDLQFEALSYTWGDSKRSCVVKCSGKDLCIRANLGNALQRLRHEHEPRTIWIDSLSINQQDFAERNSQVLLMGEIYNSASSVIVWLGDKAVDSTKGIQLLKKLSAMASSSDPSLSKYLPLRDVSDLERLDLPSDGSPDWEAVDALCWRPWFLRMWIIQEISLANTAVVYCGRDCISWDEMTAAIIFLNSSRISPLVGIAGGVSRVLRLTEIKKVHRWYGAVHLHDLLLWSLDSTATESRDHTYALLGLTSKAVASNVEVNYEITIPDLFASVAVQLLQESKALYILNSRSQTGPSVTPGLPSWVPDWASRSRATALLNLTTPRPFNATRDSEYVPQLTSNLLFSAIGYEIDEIKYSTQKALMAHSGTGFADRFGGGKVVDDAKSVFRGAVFLRRETLAATLKTYPTGEDIGTAYSTTLIGSQRLLTKDTPSLEELYEAVRLDFLYPWKIPPQWNTKSKPFKPNLEHSDAYAEYKQAVYNLYWNRKFCTTRNGYMGLMPLGTLYRDKIVLFAGGKTPFVIRKESDGMWSFIGECYLHGMMYGEGWDPCRKMQEFKFI